MLIQQEQRSLQLLTNNSQIDAVASTPLDTQAYRLEYVLKEFLSTDGTSRILAINNDGSTGLPAPLEGTITLLNLGQVDGMQPEDSPVSWLQQSVGPTITVQDIWRDRVNVVPGEGDRAIPRIEIKGDISGTYLVVTPSLEIDPQKNNTPPSTRFVSMSLLDGPHLVLADHTAMVEALLERLIAEQSPEQRLRNLAVGMLLHKVKTPLSVVLTSLYLFRKIAGNGENLTETALDKLDDIEQAALEAKSVIASLTQYVTADLRLETTQVLDAQLIGSAIEHATVGHNIAVNMEVEPEAKVKVDPILLSEVLANFIDNSRKYGATQVVFKVATELVGTETAVVMRIIDDGPGIPTGLEKKIFAPFYRCKPHSAMAPEGSGLGLALVKEVIETLGGTVYASNVLNSDTTTPAGACFTITLPFAPQ